MEQKHRLEALRILEQTQQNTSKIKIQIGHTNQENLQVHHNTLYIQDCPPKAIQKLQENGFRLSQHNRLGLRVEKQ